MSSFKNESEGTHICIDEERVFLQLGFLGNLVTVATEIVHGEIYTGHWYGFMYID